jgi:hypothetical protein
MMRYPILPLTKCRELSARLLGGSDVVVDVHAEWTGSGDELDLEPIAEAGRLIARRASEWTDKDRDRFEGMAAIRLVESLEHVPVEVLDNRGFWRFLSLRFFWAYIVWREETPFSKGNYLKYVDATLGTECVLTRMYLRARAVRGPGASELAAGIPHGTDFWRSHVLRVRTGTAPAIARAFAHKQAETRLMTDPLRQAARRLNRTWANVILHVYEDNEASWLIDSVWVEASDD